MIRRVTFMFATLLGASLLSSSAVQGALVTESVDITASFAGTSPQTTQVVFDDGGGNTVTVDLTLSSNVAGTYSTGGVTVDGDLIQNLFFNGGSGNRGAFFDNKGPEENAIFTASLVSTTGTVDASSIEFRIDSVGVRIGVSDLTAGELAFSSSATSSFDILGSNGDITQYALDITFADLDAADYVGTLTIDPSLSADTVSYQLNDLAGGLVVTAQFASVVPEPGMLALILSIGVCGLVVVSRRRFRK